MAESVLVCNLKARFNLDVRVNTEVIRIDRTTLALASWSQRVECHRHWGYCLA